MNSNSGIWKVQIQSHPMFLDDREIFFIDFVDSVRQTFHVQIIAHF